MPNILKRKNIGQPEIMVAETTIGKDNVTFSLPKSILNDINLDKQSYFCITNGIIQISGEVPSATIPIMSLNEDSFMPQSDGNV